MSSTDECLNILEHPCHGIQLIDKKALLIHATTGMDLKGIMLSEKRQFQNVLYCMIPFI